MDQNQPQWSPPPQQPVGWGGPGYGGAPVRPTGVTLGAIYLIVMGILVGLVGACSSLIGGAVTGGSSQAGGFGGVLGAAGSFLLVLGVIILILGILSVAAGAGALGGSGWARWTGIVVSVLMVIIFALLTIGSLGSLNAPGSGGATGLVFSLVILIGYGLTAWAFMKATPWFARR
jgi:hypothetical protein